MSDLERIRENWPHLEPFNVVDGRCGVCGYDYAEHGGSVELRTWVAAHNWAVTTEADCLGWTHPIGDVKYALYDVDEDDPPIALFDFRDDAERVAAALNAFGGRSDGLLERDSAEPFQVPERQGEGDA